MPRLQGGAGDPGEHRNPLHTGDYIEPEDAKFTVQPKSITIFEFKKEWLEYKRATALTKQEGLAELKQAIQTTQRKAVLDMKEEEEIFAHLMVLFGNPKLLHAQRLEEAKGWSKCSGTDIQVRDWLSHVKTRVESTY
jgi:hypothetical protein